MKANSNHHPGDFTRSKSKTFVNYNIKEIEVTDEHGTRTAYDYDYVEIKGDLTKAKFKEALGKRVLEEKDTEEWTPTAAILEYRNEIKVKAVAK